jgi:hypothetical protein
MSLTPLFLVQDVYVGIYVIPVKIVINVEAFFRGLIWNTVPEICRKELRIFMEILSQDTALSNMNRNHYTAENDSKDQVYV